MYAFVYFSILKGTSDGHDTKNVATFSVRRNDTMV